MVIFRAAVALLLIAGFYSLAAAAVGVLVYLPYASWVHLGVFHAGPTGLCAVGVISIVYAVLPRREVFLPPGPRLTREEQPRFIAVVEEVAGAVGQPMPEEIYLLPELNAWVSRRGGIVV